MGEESLTAKFSENFLRVKSHSGEEKNTGKQKCFGGEIWGAKKILEHIFIFNGFSIELI